MTITAAAFVTNNISCYGGVIAPRNLLEKPNKVIQAGIQHKLDKFAKLIETRIVADEHDMSKRYAQSAQELHYAQDYDVFGSGRFSVKSAKVVIEQSYAFVMPWQGKSVTQVVVGTRIHVSMQYDIASSSSEKDQLQQSYATDPATFIIRIPASAMPVTPIIAGFNIIDFAQIEMQQSEELKRRENEPWWMEFFNPIKW